LNRLEAEAKKQTNEQTQQAELRLVIHQLQEFAARIKSGLQDADWSTRREIIRTLVKRVEIDETQVHVIYRINSLPFDHGPERGRLQDCWRRDFTAAGQRLPALRAGRVVSVGGATATPGARPFDSLCGRLRDPIQA
jgi:site-specific DNA recombinase